MSGISCRKSEARDPRPVSPGCALPVAPARFDSRNDAGTQDHGDPLHQKHEAPGDPERKEAVAACPSAAHDADPSGTQGSRRFRPQDRLHSSGEFERVKREGKRSRTAHCGINFAPNDLGHHRLGLVVQKRFWCAVKRNRIKRVLREWFRLYKGRIPLPARDIVVIARPGAEKLSPRDIAVEFSSSFGSRNGGN
jgi:ribonuclease P protein component